MIAIIISTIERLLCQSTFRIAIVLASAMSGLLSHNSVAQSQPPFILKLNAPCAGQEQIFAFVAPDGNCNVSEWTINGGRLIRTGQNTATAIWDYPTDNASVYTAGWCGGAGTGQFTIKPWVTPSVSLSVPSSICVNQKFTVSAAPTHGGSFPYYAWYLDGVQLAETSTATYEVNKALSPGTHSMYVRMSSSAECVNSPYVVSPTVNFTIQAKASFTARLMGPQLVCANIPSAGYFALVENRTGDLGTLSYQFWRNGNPVTTDAVDVLNVPHANEGDQVFCIVSSNRSCVIDPVRTETHTLRLTPPSIPGLGILVPNQANFCEGEILNLDVNSPGITSASRFTWTVNGQQFSTSKQASIPVTMDVNATHKFSPGDIIKVVVTNMSGTCVSAGNNTGEADTRFNTLNIYPLTTATISTNIQNNSLLCPESVIATTITEGGAIPEYTWIIDGKPGVIGTWNYPVSNLAPGLHTVAVKLKSDKMCTAPVTSVTQSFNINRAPQVSAGADMVINGPDGSLYINGSVSDADEIPAIAWTLVSGGSILMAQTNTPSLQLPQPRMGTYKFRLTATDLCTSISDEMTLTIAPPFNNYNYIISNSVLVPGVTTTQEVKSLTVEKRNQSIQYYDGLGRPMQRVITQGSPLKKDVVQPELYDEFGRQTWKHLPFVSNEENGYYKQLEFTDKKDYTHAFYDLPNDKIIDDNRPFSETVFDASPLNRPVKTYGPGDAWGPQQKNKFVLLKYVSNTFAYNQEKIIAWRIDNAGLPARHDAATGYIEPGGYYSTGQLFITSSIDEQGNEVRQYTDKQGKVILKKVQAVNSAVLSMDDHWAQTYYIYDDAGNLRMVLSPEATKELLK